MTETMTCPRCDAELRDEMSQREGACSGWDYFGVMVEWTTETFTPTAPGWEVVRPFCDDGATVTFDRLPVVGWVTRTPRLETVNDPVQPPAPRVVPAVFVLGAVTAVDDAFDVVLAGAHVDPDEAAGHLAAEKFAVELRADVERRRRCARGAGR